MSSTADQIEAMLDRVAERQIICPECGRPDDLYLIEPEWSTRMVGAPIGGGLILGDTDTDYVALPEGVVPKIPRLVACGNHPVYEEARTGCVWSQPEPQPANANWRSWHCTTHNCNRSTAVSEAELNSQKPPEPPPTCMDRRCVTTFVFFTIPDDTEIEFDAKLLAELKGW